MTDVTFVVLNVGRGGGKLDPHAAIPTSVDDGDRWHDKIVPRLASVTWPDGTVHKPAIIGFNELCGWDDTRLQSAADDFDMAHVGLTPKPGYPSGMIYDPAQLGDRGEWNTDHNDSSHHGIGAARFDPAGLPGPLGVALTHLTPFDPEAAASEAHLANLRAYRWGCYGIVMGDMNYLPLVGHTFDPSDMLPHNWENRFERPDEFYETPWAADGPHPAPAGMRLKPRLGVARALRGAEFYDAAAVMFARTGDDRYLRWTCPSMRIDWICLSWWLVPALVDYQVLDRVHPDDTEVDWVADHHPVAVRIRPSLASRENVFVYH